MICTPGWIRTQLPVESYRRMDRGQVRAAEWNACPVECRQCGKTMLASSLGHHLAHVHDIYQSQMVAEELLEHRPPATYTVMHWRVGKLVCPFPICEGILNDSWNLRRHFWDVHPMDLVVVLSEGKHQRCQQCGMQVKFYPRHYTSNECRIGVERKQQQETAVTLALALQQQFSVNGDVWEWVELFKYLGRLLAQNDDDIQAIRTQLQKARATWARVGQVLWRENSSPRIAAKSLRPWCRPCYSKVARLGSSLRKPWLDWRGSIFTLPIGWQSGTSLARGRDINGFIRGRRMCWRSAGCIPLQNTSMFVGRQSLCTWRPTRFLTNECRVSGSEKQYHTACGGSK